MAKKSTKSMYPLNPPHPTASSATGDAGKTGPVIDKSIDGRGPDKNSIGTYKTKKGKV